MQNHMAALRFQAYLKQLVAGSQAMFQEGAVGVVMEKPAISVLALRAHWPVGVAFGERDGERGEAAVLLGIEKSYVTLLADGFVGWSLIGAR
jgi:hypothetical protein